MKTLHCLNTVSAVCAACSSPARTIHTLSKHVASAACAASSIPLTDALASLKHAANTVCVTCRSPWGAMPKHRWSLQ